jgi:hypothetical protein
MEEKNFTVRICEDYVIQDSEKVKEILDRISKTITNSYKKRKSNNE